MSILIKGIKMPTSCAECPMGSVLYGYKCLAKNKQFDRYAFNSMQEWCPLIEIPDKHGRLIDGDKLRQTMYHEAFETDSPMQKWDSGCWIRYKMFENIEENAPTIIGAERE